MPHDPESAERAVASPPSIQRVSSAVRAVPRLIGTASVAALLAAIPIAWGALLETVPALTLLLVPATLAISFLVMLGAHTLPGRRLRGNGITTARGAVIALGAAFVLALGFYVSNAALLAYPTDRATIFGYALTLALAAASAFFLRRGSRRAAPAGRWIAQNPRVAFVGSLALLGVGFLVLASEATFVVPPYVTSAALVAGLVLLTGGITLIGVHTEVAILPLLACAALVAFGPSTMHRGLRAAFTTRNASRFVVRAARSVLDRDGDGFSNALEGGDCDESDDRVFPMSPVSDCKGWRAVGVPFPAAASVSTPAAAVPVPKRIILLTLDAFRCGFGRGDLPELRDICPELTAIGQEGALRVDAHTTAPATRRAIHSLMAGTLEIKPRGQELYLPLRLAELGYSTHAIVTHQLVFGDPVARSAFQTVDDSLIPIARQPNRVTSSLVTARLLDAISAADPRAFIWAHYFDAHATYVYDERYPFALPRMIAYPAEVRRQDASLGELFRAIRAMPGAEDTVVFVTADHGEQLGKKGFTEHGFSLYEGGVRTPMVAWSPGAALRARIRSMPLPVSIEEVHTYLTALAEGKDFTPGEAAFFYTTVGDRSQFGIVKGGLKLIYHFESNVTELFDIAKDPMEENDISLAHPDIVAELGSILSRRYFDRRALIPPDAQPSRAVGAGW